jgi:hypothetical protein
MSVLRLVTATGLALWLGFLACVLGCSQSVLASTPASIQIFESKAAENDVDTNTGDAGSCCHHHQGTPGKNNQGLQSISCCPLDATLIQKRDPASFVSIHSYTVVLMLFVLNSSFRVSVSDRVDSPHVCHAGRDVLLETHVLRI